MVTMYQQLHKLFIFHQETHCLRFWMRIKTTQLPLAVCSLFTGCSPFAQLSELLFHRGTADLCKHKLKPHCKQHMALFNPEQAPGLRLERQAQQSSLPRLSLPLHIACSAPVPGHGVPRLSSTSEDAAA